MEKANLNYINDEHQQHIKQLGSIELNVKLKFNSNKENMEETLTVFTFLKKIYDPKYLVGKEDDEDRKHVRVSKLVNDLTDGDIKNIIKYIDSLNNDDIPRKEKKSKIYHLLPVSLKEEYGVSKRRALELKKESLVLGLMNLGINPFKIRECLQNESNKSEFKSLTWNKICEDAVSFKKEIQDSMDVYHENTKEFAVFNAKNRWDIPLVFLNYMYLIETLKNQNANDEIINLCYKNISDGEYISDGFEDAMIPFFLIKYLKYKFGNQENKGPMENLLKQKNKILVENLEALGNEQDDQLILSAQNTEEKSIDLFFYNINFSCTHTFHNVWNDNSLYKFLIPKFWEIIDGLPEECIFAFTVEMMREVTLTKQQLNSVKEKIQNENLRLYLEKFNYNLDHKKGKENIIRKGTKISWANYLCEKLFRGVGWLPGIILAAFLLELEILAAIAFAHWFITLCCIGTAFVIVKILVLDYMIRDKNSIFRKCVDFMQRAYDKTVGHWMQIWALHYPVNNIPEPENRIFIPLNTQSSEINLKRDKPNENENTPQQTGENNYIKNNDNNNIEGPDNNN